MRAPIIALALLCASCPPAPAPSARKPPVEMEESTTYLASISVPLKEDERLETFSFDTWGVRVLAICHIPSGWRITGGGSAAPDGVIAGEGSHGVTWLSDMKSLENLVLVRMYGPVQQADGNGAPATFKGKATIETDDLDREAVLTHTDIRLTPAAACP